MKATRMAKRENRSAHSSLGEKGEEGSQEEEEKGSVIGLEGSGDRKEITAFELCPQRGKKRSALLSIR